MQNNETKEIVDSSGHVWSEHVLSRLQAARLGQLTGTTNETVDPSERVWHVGFEENIRRRWCAATILAPTAKEAVAIAMRDFARDFAQKDGGICDFTSVSWCDAYTHPPYHD